MKTKEACKSTDNLCLNCKNKYPSCDGRIRFGNVLGNDNIRGCTSFDEFVENKIPYLEIDMDDEEFESVYED